MVKGGHRASGSLGRLLLLPGTDQVLCLCHSHVWQEELKGGKREGKISPCFGDTVQKTLG